MQKLQRENKGGAVENTCGKSQMQKMQKKIISSYKEKMMFQVSLINSVKSKIENFTSFPHKFGKKK